MIYRVIFHLAAPNVSRVARECRKVSPAPWLLLLTQWPSFPLFWCAGSATVSRQHGRILAPFRATPGGAGSRYDAIMRNTTAVGCLLFRNSWALLDKYFDMLYVCCELSFLPIPWGTWRRYWLFHVSGLTIGSERRKFRWRKRRTKVFSFWREKDLCNDYAKCQRILSWIH